MIFKTKLLIIWSEEKIPDNKAHFMCLLFIFIVLPSHMNDVDDAGE